MADGNLSRTDTINAHTVNTRRRTTIGYILIAAFGSLFLFLLAYYLQQQFPQLVGLWEALKTLAIALFPAIVVAIVDHFHVKFVCTGIFLASLCILLFVTDAFLRDT